MHDYPAAPAAAQAAAIDDWFGEGNAFESGEELASALLAMAEKPPEEAPLAEPAASVGPSERESFLLLDPEALRAPSPVAETAPRAEAPAAPRSWSVRAPGAVPLPPRAPGRSGWTIRNSVQVLQRTEEVINSLRHEAVVAALAAAARALHPHAQGPHTV